VASIESREILEETAKLSEQGKGTCVGRKFSGIEWRVIEINDGSISDINETRQVSPGEIGELMVCGPVVSKQYVTREDQNALHKVRDGDRVWHRIGDVGYMDQNERFWYCGRKSHRVTAASGPLFTDPCEAIFNTHPSIYRSALIGQGKAGSQHPAIIVEPWKQNRPAKGSKAERALLEELRQLAQANSVTQSIHDICIYPRRLPTDIRHNSKIFREQLVPWHERETKKARK
jgi:acyl-CoA synthetase (AMP-forming)/AMP-acid ligase II